MIKCFNFCKFDNKYQTAMSSKNAVTFQMFDLVRPASSSITTADGKVGIGIGFVLENNEFVVKKLLPGSEASSKVVPWLHFIKLSDIILHPNYFYKWIQIQIGDMIKSVDGTGMSIKLLQASPHFVHLPFHLASLLFIS
jgi:hypothetical protein